jgi:hypothetical protein
LIDNSRNSLGNKIRFVRIEATSHVNENSRPNHGVDRSIHDESPAQYGPELLPGASPLSRSFWRTAPCGFSPACVGIRTGPGIPFTGAAASGNLILLEGCERGRYVRSLAEFRRDSADETNRRNEARWISDLDHQKNETGAGQTTLRPAEARLHR